MTAWDLRRPHDGTGIQVYIQMLCHIYIYNEEILSDIIVTGLSGICGVDLELSG